MYEQGDAPEYSREEWMSVKNSLGLDFPNLPYLTDGELKLTETAAIMYYLANKYDPDLLGRTPAERAKMDMIFSIVSSVKGKVTVPCYSSGNPAEIVKAYRENMPSILDALGNNKFIVGDYPTIVDFLFYEMNEMVNHCGFKGRMFEEFPRLEAYQEAVRNLPNVKAYIESERFIERPYNNKIAKLNN